MGAANEDRSAHDVPSRGEIGDRDLKGRIRVTLVSQWTDAVPGIDR
jgi:hypothetical protein